MNARVVLLATITVMATASGTSRGDDRVRASCNRPAAGTCTEYSGTFTPVQLEQLRTDCLALATDDRAAFLDENVGIWSMTNACPTARRVGSCSFEPLGSASEVVHVYSSRATSVTTARRLCTSGQLELGSGLLRMTSDNPDLLAMGEPGTWSASTNPHDSKYARRPARRGAVNVREAKDEQADDEASSIARGGTGTGDAMSRPEPVINYESDLLCAAENEDPACTSAAATPGGDGK